MKMELVGMTGVKEGMSKKNKPYMTCDLHLMGKSSRVEGKTVRVQFVNLLELTNAPPFVIGNTYSIETDDKGYLQEIELLEEAKPSSQPGPAK